jgi:hypothetical protein
VSALLSSVRRKLFGETRAIPLGIAGSLLLALLFRAVLPRSEWQLAGGFALTAAVIATLIRSLPIDKRRAGARITTAQPTNRKPQGATDDPLAMGGDRPRNPRPPRRNLRRHTSADQA